LLQTDPAPRYQYYVAAARRAPPTTRRRAVTAPPFETTRALPGPLSPMCKLVQSAEDEPAPVTSTVFVAAGTSDAQPADNTAGTLSLHGEVSELPEPLWPTCKSFPHARLDQRL